MFSPFLRRVSSSAVPSERRAKISEKIKSVTQLGFRDEAWFEEVGHPGGLLIFPVIYFQVLFGEQGKILPSLTVSTFFPVLLNSDSTCMATPIRLGVVFKTFFEDGKILITANTSASVLNKDSDVLEKGVIRREDRRGSDEDTLAAHAQAVRHLEAIGRKVRKISLETDSAYYHRHELSMVMITVWLIHIPYFAFLIWAIHKLL